MNHGELEITLFEQMDLVLSQEGAHCDQGNQLWKMCSLTKKCKPIPPNRW